MCNEMTKLKNEQRRNGSAINRRKTNSVQQSTQFP
jgi:hypothetical protein